jgi:NAD+ synthase
MSRSSLDIDVSVVELVLTKFIRNEFYKAGFKRAVIGLSGGIDSALSCLLAASALGPSNVCAILLPSEISNPQSLEHARLVIDKLGVSSEQIDISPITKPLFQVSPEINARRRGNVMARTRMLILFDRSMAWKALVLGTSNKSELLLGYGTLFGDLASAVNPLGDLYKTQVRQLAQAMDVPSPIIEKAPTADLIPGQTDEGDLGFTYAEVDKLLQLLVDERYSLEETIAAGFEPDLVERVVERIRWSHFKRTMPIIPKLSGRTVGHDFRYLRDANQ